MKKSTKTEKPVVTILIPAKDEGAGLASVIRSVARFGDEIIIIDGHSNDDTKEICRQAGVGYYLDHGNGRGDAVKLGIAKARGTYIVLFDADGSHDASDIPLFLAPLKKNRADLVIGSRRTGGSSDMKLNFDGLIRSAGADLLTIMLNRRFNTNYTDIIYSLRAATRKALASIPLAADDFCIEQEMVVQFLKRNLRVLEIPSRERARSWGEPKLKTITGFRLVWQLFLDLYVRR